MYIIRTAFWISAIILLLPAGNETLPEQEDHPGKTAVSATETIGAAVSAVGDIADLCNRQPAICETGSAAWQVFQSKARYGVSVLYDWAQGEDSPADAVDGTKDIQVRAPTKDKGDGTNQAPYKISFAADPFTTGSTAVARPYIVVAAKKQKSQNTLKLEDLIPQWKGPRATVRA